jgi:hypothetical protein
LKSGWLRVVGFLLRSAPGRLLRHRASAQGFRIAAFLATAAALAATEAACFPPQDIEEAVDAGQVNLPPYFDDTKDVSPTDAEICIEAGTPKEFKLRNLRDPNNSTLQARWFVDYKPDHAAPVKIVDLPAPAEQPFYYLPLTFSSVDIEPLYRAPDTNTHYLLEVVVSDGFSGDGLPKNRAPADGHFAVSYHWSFIVKTTCE